MGGRRDLGRAVSRPDHCLDEFIHAAPWSVAQQGSSNVGHDCTGMSPANAEWRDANTNVGDVVEYVGTDKPRTLTNGFGDWNASYADYRAGSALQLICRG